MNFEYKTIAFNPIIEKKQDSLDVALNKILNILALENWEFYNTIMIGGWTESYLVFRRQKPEYEEE